MITTVQSYSLKNFKIITRQDNSVLIYFLGNSTYKRIFKETYQSLNIWGPFDAIDKFDYVLRVDDVESQLINQMQIYLEKLKDSIYISDSFSQTFALGYHGTDSYYRNLIYRAKPYNSGRDLDISACDTIVEHLKDFIEANQIYKKADYLVAIPCDKTKEFDVPRYLVNTLSEITGISNGNQLVYKTRPSKVPQKDVKLIKQKHSNVKGMFDLTQNVEIRDKIIIVLDDIYGSGATLSTMRQTLENSGATTLGLTVTKTFRDINL